MCPDILAYTRARGHDLEVILPCIFHDMPDQLFAQLAVFLFGQQRMVEDDGPRPEGIFYLRMLPGQRKLKATQLSVIKDQDVHW